MIAPAKRGRPGRIVFHRAVVVTLLLAGTAVTSWPVAETYLGNRAGAVTTGEYLTSVQQLPETLRNEELDQATQYNLALLPTALQDPWGESRPGADADRSSYLASLSRTTAMGRLRIEAIDVDLPIFHDADAESMARGVGHMYGSSLPVGGAGSHAVLAAHTGLRGRTMFDRLPELELGERFEIEVAGATLSYGIDQILVVEPWDLDAIAVVPGQDYVTLVTCYTPPGGHKQRLLVRGSRLSDLGPAIADSVETVATAVTVDTTVQPWMWPRLAGTGTGLVILVVILGSWAAADRRRRDAMAWSQPARRAYRPGSAEDRRDQL